MVNDEYVTSKYFRTSYQKKYHANDKNTLRFSDIVCMAYIAYMFSGSTVGSFLYIGMFLFIFTIFMFLIQDRKSLIKSFQDKKLLCFLIYWLFILMIGLPVGGLFYTAKQLGSAILLFSPIIIFNYYYQRDCGIVFKKILAWSLLILIGFSVYSLLFYGQYENAARDLASNAEYYGTVAIGGGYALAYGSAILSVFLFDLKIGKHIKNKWLSLLFWPVFILLTLVVIQTESTITFVCWCIGIAITLLFRPNRRKPGTINLRTIMNWAVVILVVVGLLLCIAPFGKWLIGITAGGIDMLSVRLNSLAYGLAYGSGNSGGSYFFDRLSIPLKSLNTFLQNPFIGIGIQHGNGFFYTGSYGIGNHCEWADALGNYGIIGGIPFLLIYIFSMISTQKNGSGCISFGWLTVWILMGVFNPFRTFQSQFVAFYLIPGILLYIRYCVDNVPVLVE